MRLIGFGLSEDMIGVKTDGQYFDLHNNFDFHDLTYNILERKVELFWKKGEGDWVPQNSPSGIKLVVQGVSIFKSKQRDPEVPYSEDDCLNTIGFFWNNMIEEMESYCTNVPDENCTHLLLTFMSGFALKIAGETANLEVKK